MAFSENLIKYRKLKAYTQDDIAELTGVSRQSVSKWENGESMPDMNKIIKIAESLDVSLDVLFDRDNVVKTEMAIDDIQISAFAFSPITEGKSGMKIEFVSSKYNDTYV